MRIAWMFTLLACIGWAQGALQNSEVIYMAGGASSSASIIPGTSAMISGTVGFATQIGYGYQLKSTRAGNLWLELPMTFTFQGTANISGPIIATIDRNTWFFTPGVRLKSPTYGRCSFYGSLGGGWGALSKRDSIMNFPNGTVIENYVMDIRPVFDFAGGIDLRLSRLLSLRAEGRDYVSGADLGGVSGRNHPVFLGGLVFHF